MSETPERWEKSGPFDHNGNPWEEDAAGEGSWPMWPILGGNSETIAECWDERYADLICALHNDRAGLNEARLTAAEQYGRSCDQVMDALAKGLERARGFLDSKEQALTAERERAEKAEHDVAFFTDAMDDAAGVLGVFGPGYLTREQLESQLQAEREKAALAEEMARYMHEPAFLPAENWKCANGHQWAIAFPISAGQDRCPECGKSAWGTDSKRNPPKWDFDKAGWLARYDALTPTPADAAQR